MASRTSDAESALATSRTPVAPVFRASSGRSLRVRPWQSCSHSARRRGFADEPPHLVTQLRLRVQHGRDRDGVVIGPDHDEPSLVTAQGTLGSQPVAEHAAQGNQGEKAGPSSDDGHPVAVAPVSAHELERDGAHGDRNEDPDHLLRLAARTGVTGTAAAASL